MIVSTINVNGIRAAVKQRSTENLGLLAWLKETTADAVCLQETRADDEQLADALAPALADGWHLASADPHLKGRNGVAVLSRHPITRVRIGPDADEFASHGRYLEVDTGDLTVASVYFPTGEADTDRQLEKERFMAAVAARMAVLNASSRGAVVCGDWNIAHTESDIKAWKANQKKSGFLPSERQWLTDLLATGWVDVVRVLHPGVAGPTAGGRGAARRSTTTRGGGSTTSWPAPRWRRRAVGARVERADGLRAALVRPRAGDRRIWPWPGVKVLGHHEHHR